MGRRRFAIAEVGLLIAALGTCAQASDRSAYWCGEESSSQAWSCCELSVCAELPQWRPTGEVVRDSQISAAEFQVAPMQVAPVPTPAMPRQAVSLNQAPRPAIGAMGATIGLASIPYMIGDTGGGTCLGFSGLVSAAVSHPTLACGRLNVAEANSPIPTDRFYYSYRHFHNASMVSAYQFGELVDIDQHTLAWENAFWGRTGSLEVRVPIEDRIQSNIFSIIALSSGVVDPLVGPRGGRRVELGNINLIFKMLLVQRDTWALSGGLGVTLPTAGDVNYQLAVDGEVVFPNNPGLTADEAVAFQAVFANETVYLAPYLAWAYAPPARWFHQGFLQFEVAANPSRVTVDGDGATLFLQDGTPIGFYDYFTPVPVRADLFAQTLMRLNLGWGYILAEDNSRDWRRQLAGIFELHYTTTLQDANLTDIPLTTQTSLGTVPLQNITVGNGMNRVDILNAAVGVAAQWGPWSVSNGVICPLRDATGRAFDFEYNVQVQRLF